MRVARRTSGRREVPPRKLILKKDPPPTTLNQIPAPLTKKREGRGEERRGLSERLFQRYKATKATGGHEGGGRAVAVAAEHGKHCFFHQLHYRMHRRPLARNVVGETQG